MCDVLVVDDQSLACLTLARLFRVAGHESECAPGGAEAIAYLGRRPPRLVLLDLMMPEVDGFDVLTWMAGHPQLASVAVVVYSAVCELEFQERAMALGARECIAKGLPWADLYRRLASYLTNDDPRARR